MKKKLTGLVLSLLLVAGCSSGPNDPADNMQNFQTALKEAFNKSVERIDAAEFLYIEENSLDIIRTSIAKDDSLLSIVTVGLEFELCPFTFDILSTTKDYGAPVPLYLLSGATSPELTVASIAAVTAKGTESRWIVRDKILHVITNAYEDINVITIALTASGEVAYHAIRVSRDDFDTTLDKTLNNDFDNMAPISTVRYAYGDARNAESTKMSKVLPFNQQWWLDNYKRLVDLDTQSLNSSEDSTTTTVLTSNGDVLLAKENNGVFSFYTLDNKPYKYEGETVQCQAKM